jgi:hypothetical protein
MFIVGNKQMTVAGGNITLSCVLLDGSSSRLYWSFKAIDKEVYELVHNGIRDDPPRYDDFAVSINDSLSYLTLKEASMKFAGKYKCQKDLNGPVLTEIELVVLGECLVLKISLLHIKQYSVTF